MASKRMFHGIDVDRVNELRTSGSSWSAIAEILGPAAQGPFVTSLLVRRAKASNEIFVVGNDEELEPLLHELHRRTARLWPATTVESRNVVLPITPQIILDLLLPPNKCEALVGDMEEIYRKKQKRLGKNGADLWYWKQVIITIWPLIRAARRTCIINLVVFVLRMLGLGRIADQLKAASRAAAGGERDGS